MISIIIPAVGPQPGGSGSGAVSTIPETDSSTVVTVPQKRRKGKASIFQTGLGQ